MRVITGHSRPTSEIPSSSMADIAFLLLVFFLVTTVFPRDRGLSLILPEREAIQPIAPDNLLQLLVPDAGPIEVRRGSERRGESIAPEDVEHLWRAEAARNSRLVAVVRTGPNARYQRMITVLDALKRAGADRISLQILDPT